MRGVLALVVAWALLSIVVVLAVDEIADGMP